ncbi:hypothetical protein SESBI_25240 [Sesbania bispinosa]|nr:hypothetical protein SESBI_25240 [Sesbania bispinosa]
MDVLALTIYGIVIFPNADDFVDLASIDIFLAQKSRGENPVPAVLADVYHTLNYCYVKKGKRILCCLPALYVWLTAHIFDRKLEVIKNGPKHWQVSMKVQFGGIHDGRKYKSMDPIKTEELRRVRQAWDNIIRKGKELGVRSCGTTESYHQWVKNRVVEVKLPFSVTLLLEEDISLPSPIDNEELKEVKVKLERVEKEKKDLEVQFKEIRQAYEALQLENTEKSRSLEKANKRARADREQANKTMGCWLAADEELGLRRQERNKAKVENQHLRELLGNSEIAKREIQKELDNMKQQMQEMVVECERKIKKKHEDIQGLLGQLKEKDDVVYQSKKEMMFWATRFANLVWIANGAIEDVPRLLKMANAMVNPLTTPEEICNFIEHCKSLMRQMKQWMDCNN